jgi:hypothetical protein
MTAPGGPGITGSAYAAVAHIDSFSQGMARLAELFTSHPELRWMQASTDPEGHVDIIVSAGTGVLHSWVHALPTARRTKDLYSVHSGAAYEDVLTEGMLKVHVRKGSGAA